MALEHILRKLNDGPPETHGPYDLHVPLHNIVYADSPIGVAPVTVHS
jgi:hypothetical protein